ncbi:Carbon starvation protein A [Hafnia alvei]|uniref:Carbon starvation protein A n=1 Tax=Hafnia alvei TaxID=569 RepID=A0A377PD41_HAFAL|nr:Carbon starvation protein A [Hafnia alvei]
MLAPEKSSGDNNYATRNYIRYCYAVYPYDLLPFIRIFFVKKVLRADDNEVTPSHTFEDGKDYVPTKKWVNFGSHFAAIAAAGPLVGPVLAAQFGYLPGFLWLLIGCVVGGAVHDTVVLFASMKHQGKSLSEVAKSELGRLRAGVPV